MSQTELPVDVGVLRDEIRKTYTDVSTDAEQDFIFPTGRAWAEELGYPQPELSRVPGATVESFAGVANHWTLGRIEPGSVVLDLGCGAGTDLLIAAQMTGPDGRVIGVGALLEGEHARLLVQRAYTDIAQGELVDTYARSTYEDTRRKAAKFGAMRSTIRATKPRRD